MSVYEKLATIQSRLKAPKGQYNSFGQYKYRSAEDILEAVKPLLNDVGAVLVLSDNINQIGDRYYITATARLFDTEDGTELCNTAHAREDENKRGMDGSQITGTASSYARKYALNGLFAIDDSRDADTDEYQKTTHRASESKEPVLCADCGKPLAGKTCKGKKYTPEDVANGTIAKYGQPLCWDCSYKRAKPKAAPKQTATGDSGRVTKEEANWIQGAYELLWGDEWEEILKKETGCPEPETLPTSEFPELKQHLERLLTKGGLDGKQVRMNG